MSPAVLCRTAWLSTLLLRAPWFEGLLVRQVPRPEGAKGLVAFQHSRQANSQWRWDKDGVVHYPLNYRKLIVELPAKDLDVQTFARRSGRDLPQAPDGRSGRNDAAQDPGPARSDGVPFSSLA